MARFQATTKAAEAPDVEAAIYDGLLTKVEGKTVKGGKYQKNEAGDPKLEWSFTLLDDDGDVIYDKGEPVVVGKLTGVGFNVQSKTVPHEVRILQALLTEEEYAEFLAGKGTPDSDIQVAAGGMLGRKAQVEVYVKEDGWPGIGNVIKARKAKKKAAAVEAE